MIKCACCFVVGFYAGVLFQNNYKIENVAKPTELGEKVLTVVQDWLEQKGGRK
uniref:Hypotheticial protein n=1 Tax=Schistosoma japonicum TaxID=6182 RepID=C1L4C1_SCHJA|nr:hypotheticial protein [Schistosoma japonicum]